MCIMKKSQETITLLDHLFIWLLVSYFHHSLYYHLLYYSNIIQQYSSHDSDSLWKIVNDTRRFARAFSSIIENHPLLVYTSALSFTPTNTTLYQTFSDSHLRPAIVGSFPPSWSSLLQILVGHVDDISSVKVSPDSTRPVSNSMDCRVRLWHSVTTIEILEMRGHKNQLCTVAFSPDKMCISSGSSISGWDVTTGHQDISFLKDDWDLMSSVAFFLHGRRFISAGSSHVTMRLCNFTKGAQIVELQGHLKTINSVDISTDRVRVISGSDDGAIGVWNWSEAFDTFILRGHRGSVRAVDCSRDGSWLVSSSIDGTVQIWDLIAGAEIYKLQGDLDWIHSIISSDDRTIQIWDASSGEEVCESIIL
jgi:WD40 repeat protein